MPEIFDADTHLSNASSEGTSNPPPPPSEVPPHESHHGHHDSKHHHHDYAKIMGRGDGGGFFASYIPMPKGVHLEVQHEEEKILLLLRRHPLTNLGWILIVLGMIAASFLLSSYPFFDLLPGKFQFMTYLLWYFLVAAVALQGFFNWYFDAFIITDERIIDVDFKNLIYKNITATKIDNIEDVTYSVSGAFPSMLDFGNVLIQTAGAGMKLNPDDTMATIEMWNTPNPSRVAKLINELMMEEEQEKIEGRVR